MYLTPGAGMSCVSEGLTERMRDVGGDEGQAMDAAGGRRSSLVGQALIPSPSDAVSELHKERSFCNPEDTEEAAAIGRQVSSSLVHNFKHVSLSRDA